MARPIKRKPAKGFVDYDTAMALARHKGKAVRCDEYMQAGWKVMWFKAAKGFFNINPITGSNYQYRPQLVDTRSVQWRVVE